jgi:hypothetical protein
VILADTFAIPSAGFVAVHEYDSSPPPAGSLGLDENPSLLGTEVDRAQKLPGEVSRALRRLSGADRRGSDSAAEGLES